MILFTYFYDEEPEKNILFNDDWGYDSFNPWPGRSETADKKWFWKNKFSCKGYEYVDNPNGWEPENGIEIYAPMEEQPYPEFINCLEFNTIRMANIKKVLELKEPRTHGALTRINMNDYHEDAFPWNGVGEGSENRAQLALKRKFYRPRLFKWLEHSKSDIEFRNYINSGMKGEPPELWSDEYYGYDNLCPFEPGEYLSDGVYACDSWGDDTLYLYKISEPDIIFDKDTGKEIDGW